MTRFAALPPNLRGIAWMLVAAACYTAMVVQIRWLSADYSSVQILFVRTVVAVLILAPWMVRRGAGMFRSRQWKLHGLRSVLSYFGNLTLFFGIAVVPLADLVALQFTMPLFIIVMAALILGERVGRQRWLATALGFAGVLIIVRPGFADIGIGVVAVLASAAIYGSSNIAIKVLVRAEQPEATVIIANLLMIPMAAVPAALAWSPPSLEDWGWLVAMAVVATVALLALTKAYQAADASAVIPYDFVRMPAVAALGYLLFDEVVDAWTWIGAGVIFAASYTLVRLETRGRSA